MVPSSKNQTIAHSSKFLFRFLLLSHEKIKDFTHRTSKCMKTTRKKISRKVFDAQQKRIDEHYDVGIHCIESWDNYFAPKIIQNELHVESEAWIDNFIHLQYSMASKEQIHYVCYDKDIFKWKSAWSSWLLSWLTSSTVFLTLFYCYVSCVFIIMSFDHKES